MAYRVGDSSYHIIWKLLEQAGGVPKPGDPEPTLIVKFLAAIGGTPRPGDHQNKLLQKIVTLKGGTLKPGDYDWYLLRKWLIAKGGTWAAGDLEHTLWRKILDAEATPVVPPPSAPEVRVQQGAANISDGQASPVEFGSVFQSGPVSSLIFTVFNDGTANLTTSGLSVPSGYSVTNALAGTIIPGGNDTFTVQLDTGLGAGNKAGNISFVNNDSNENPFNFPVNGDLEVPIIEDSSNATLDVPWHGFTSWFWQLGSDPAHFGIELNEDGGGFANLLFETGSARSHERASDGAPHTWVFRVAAFDSGFVRITDWVVMSDINGPV